MRLSRCSCQAAIEGCVTEFKHSAGGIGRPSNNEVEYEKRPSCAEFGSLLGRPKALGNKLRAAATSGIRSLGEPTSSALAAAPPADGTDGVGAGTDGVGAAVPNLGRACAADAPGCRGGATAAVNEPAAGGSRAGGAGGTCERSTGAARQVIDRTAQGTKEANLSILTAENARMRHRSRQRTAATMDIMSALAVRVGAGTSCAYR